MASRLAPSSGPAYARGVARFSRCGIVLQARMGSTRLPGKVLRQLAGKPMIERIVERLRRCRSVDVLVLATSTSPAETPLLEWALAHDVTVFRGSESDVLDRYVACARAHELDLVVRATGDNPFVDPESLDGLVQVFADSDASYGSALTGHGSGLPIGVGVEVMTRDALEDSANDGREPHHREHVNEYILENIARFGLAIYRAKAALHAPELTLSVDTPQDFALAETLWQDYVAEHADEDMPIEWVIDWMRSRRAGAGSAR
ncbi:MAG: acylneuraminate cytidylyltransferase [Myxococcales bacterium]|nr:acylneuraminate cytidylyltransferase [Myxococcales bacterium]